MFDTMVDQMPTEALEMLRDMLSAKIALRHENEADQRKDMAGG